MRLATLRDLYIDELKDLYSVENQLLKALPKMASAASSADLRATFEEHIEETRGHVDRLERVFEGLDASPKGKRCKGIAGIIAEGDELLKEDAHPAVKDAGLISAAQRVEHYEMAGYGCVCAYAKELGEGDAAMLLHETFEEERRADTKLSDLAESAINAEARAGRELVERM